jgi:hypothetical protein
MPLLATAVPAAIAPLALAVTVALVASILLAAILLAANDREALLATVNPVDSSCVEETA